MISKNDYWIFFISWLKITNLYSKFYVNYSDRNIEENWDVNNNIHHHKLSENKHTQWIIYAFSWEKTKEGHFFWEKINSKWLSDIGNFERNMKNGCIKKVNRFNIKNFVKS